MNELFDDAKLFFEYCKKQKSKSGSCTVCNMRKSGCGFYGCIANFLQHCGYKKVLKARWMDSDGGMLVSYGVVHCSKCGQQVSDDRYKFCPKCGSEMMK